MFPWKAGQEKVETWLLSRAGRVERTRGLWVLELLRVCVVGNPFEGLEETCRSVIDALEVCSHRHFFFGIYGYMGRDGYVRTYAFPQHRTTRMEREQDREGDQSGSSARQQGQSCVSQPYRLVFEKEGKRCALTPIYGVLSARFHPFSMFSTYPSLGTEP